MAGPGGCDDHNSNGNRSRPPIFSSLLSPSSSLGGWRWADGGTRRRSGRQGPVIVSVPFLFREQLTPRLYGSFPTRSIDLLCLHGHRNANAGAVTNHCQFARFHSLSFASSLHTRISTAVSSPPWSGSTCRIDNGIALFSLSPLASRRTYGQEIAHHYRWARQAISGGPTPCRAVGAVTVPFCGGGDRATSDVGDYHDSVEGTVNRLGLRDGEYLARLASVVQFSNTRRGKAKRCVRHFTNARSHHLNKLNRRRDFGLLRCSCKRDYQKIRPTGTRPLDFNFLRRALKIFQGQLSSLQTRVGKAKVLSLSKL